MKYILFVVLLASCAEQPAVNKLPTTYVVREYLPPVQVIVIDNCQYLYGPWGNGTVLCHKGNCNNPIHPEHTRQ